MTDLEIVRRALGAAGDLHLRTADEQAAAIVRMAETMREAIGRGGQILVFGNGGSATDAQHFAAELVGRFERERRGLPVIALTADSAILTSVANDLGYDEVFARQVEALGRTGDVAMAITTSGASANVNRALEHARAAGLTTVALTGRGGGRTAELADLHVDVPGTSTARVQEVHRTVLHVMCELIERTLDEDKRQKTEDKRQK